MGIKDILRLCVPAKLQREHKLNQIRKNIFGNKLGDGIQSVMISPHAVLDITTEIAEGVFVGDFACIGRHTYIQRGSEVLSAKIGNFCSIGTNCHIGMFEHPIENISTSSRLYLRMLKNNEFYNDIPAPAKIGSDVWLGSNSTILGGIVVGDGAVIAAGAVVTRDVPPYAVVAGVPAKIIKYRFKPEKVQELLKIKWWNWEDKKIIQNKTLFEVGKEEMPQI